VEEEEEGGEGDRKEGDEVRPATLAAVGGKGGGGAWLFVSHDPVRLDIDGDDEGGRGDNVKTLLGLRGSAESERRVGNKGEFSGHPKDTRLIHFKFEPMVRSLPILLLISY
jgi:tRNA wybutosine-synthesizing protein 3